MQVSQAGAFGCWWASSGRELLFLGDDMRTLWRVGVDGGRVGTPVELARLPPDILWIDATPDRSRFLTLAPDRTGTGSMTIVENWRAALEARR